VRKRRTRGAIFVRAILARHPILPAAHSTPTFLHLPSGQLSLLSPAGSRVACDARTAAGAHAAHGPATLMSSSICLPGLLADLPRPPKGEGKEWATLRPWYASLPMLSRIATHWMGTQLRQAVLRPRLAPLAVNLVQQQVVYGNRWNCASHCNARRLRKQRPPKRAGETRPAKHMTIVMRVACFVPAQG
jgi:hypothetical protein